MKSLPRLLVLLLALILQGTGLIAGPEAAGRFFFKTYGAEQGFTQAALMALVQDASGYVWIASENGLIRYDGTTFRKWTEIQGLPSATIENIEAIPGGGLWVATRRGVVRFQDGRITPLLLNGQIFTIRGQLMHLGSDGTLWMLREEGLYRSRDGQVERVSGRPQGWGKALASRESTGSVFMAVADGIWERRRDGSVIRLPYPGGGLPRDFVQGMAVDGRGRLWVAASNSLRYLDPGAAAFVDVSSWLPAGPFLGCIIKTNPDGSVAIPTNAGLLQIHGDRHEVLGQDQGLPGKWTVCSLVDREGNLWIAGAGLYRLQGRGYVRSFTSQEGLPSELVWSSFRDRSGTLWAGTSDGLARLGPRGWIRLPGTEGLSVSSFAEDLQGRLWIGSNNGVPFCLEPGAARAGNQVYQRLRLEGGGIPPTRSTALALGPGGILWLDDPSHGVYRIDPKAGTIHAEHNPMVDQTVHARALRVDALGRTWVATDLGLALFDGSWHRFTKADGICEDAVQGLLTAPDGSCWLLFMEARGLIRVNFKDGAFRVLERLDTGKGLASDRVYAAGLDPAGTLWVGSDRGVDRLRGAEVFHIGQGGGLPGEDCSGNGIMVEPDGNVWVGTSSGLSHIVPGRQPEMIGAIPVMIMQVQRGKAVLTPPFAKLPALAHRDATLDFHFASPTFLDERAVIYQVRLVGLEDEWRATEVPQARYTALPGGKYRFEVRAAYPGQMFGPVASYWVEILGPWWSSWWFVGLCLLAAAGLVAAFLRWRLRALAHQRSRLAALVEQRTADLLKANHALEKANLALRAQSLTDPLTGLHNRRFLSMVVDEDVATVARAYRDGPPGEFLANQDLVFFLVDLDNFKLVNDLHGHPVGDQVLVKVASALRQAARETDAVVRWGGEEFLIMARNSSRSEASLLAERITTIMAAQEVLLDSGEVLKWTCSVGFAAFPFQLDDPGWIGWERLMEIVDACLYQAKRSGRNGWVGAAARPGLARTPHSARLPWELVELRDEGVLELQAGRPVPSRQHA
jgi:diguanylate cyclase (GGDEF)-like protein